jgi:DNA-binding transcriptional LysR family regulator
MDLWHLKIFQKVVDLKGFSRAAKAVHLTQPTISSHIKELEIHYGCRLIDRFGKEALPTKAGELLYNNAEKLMTLFEETESAMAEFMGKVSGKIAIGGSTIPGNYIMPGIIGRFVKKYPDVNISLIVGDTQQIIDKILNHKLEFALVGAEKNSTKIVQKKLIKDDMRLIVPSDHPWAEKKQIKIEKLFSQPFIIREKGSGTLQSIQKSFSQKGFNIYSLNIIAEMGSTTAVIQGIKNNVGISILSPMAVKDELSSGSFTALSLHGVDLKRYFYLTTRKNRTPSPLCRAFLEYLEKSIIEVS